MRGVRFDIVPSGQMNTLWPNNWQWPPFLAALPRPLFNWNPIGLGIQIWHLSLSNWKNLKVIYKIWNKTIPSIRIFSRADYSFIIKEFLKHSMLQIILINLSNNFRQSFLGGGVVTVSDYHSQVPWFESPVTTIFFTF